jgi:hypothetical protein
LEPDVVEREETPVFLMRVPDDVDGIQRGWREHYRRQGEIDLLVPGALARPQA